MEACQFFRFLSQSIWSRIDLARRSGFAVSETTVTENILFEIYKEEIFSSSVRIYQSLDEAANGNDLEIAIRSSSGFIKLTAQCKILKKSGRYDSIYHRNQIHDLVAYARDKKGIPIYIFYNFYKGAFTMPETLCDVDLVADDYGMTFCNAHDLKAGYATRGLDAKGFQKWKIPNFNDLHPSLCQPFFKLACCIDSSATPEDIRRATGDSISDISTYSLEELQNDPWWIPLSDESYSSLPSYSRASTGQEKKFNPRFRILIEDQQSAL